MCSIVGVFELDGAARNCRPKMLDALGDDPKVVLAESVALDSQVEELHGAKG